MYIDAMLVWAVDIWRLIQSIYIYPVAMYKASAIGEDCKGQMIG